jgi:hypothetical protein
MSRRTRILFALVLLVVAGLCVFGIVATQNPRGAGIVRVIYTVVGLVALLVAGGLIFGSPADPSSHSDAGPQRDDAND